MKFHIMRNAWFAITLAIILSVFPVLGLSTDAMAQDEPLVIGSITPMTGKFFTGLWGMNTADIDVRMLLHGYATVTELTDQRLILDTSAVERLEVTTDEAGNRRHLFKIRKDLHFSDGTPIRAQEYAFSVLLQFSPLIRELGGVPVNADYLVGGTAYQQGKANALLGLRLMDEYTFSLTVREEYYPYYYELAYVDVIPYPLHSIAPGCAVVDNGQGAYVQGPFDVELLRRTILDEQTGYLSHPGVVSGPYRLDSYNSETHTAAFSVNPYFRGDINGQISTISRLVFRPIRPEEIIPALQSGEVHLVNKVSAREPRDEAKAIPGIVSSEYARQGLGFIAFLTEQPVVHDVLVRRAIAHCIDKQALVANFMGAYGETMDGYYGLGQWMYQRTRAAATWTNYPYDPAAAAALFDAAGYTLSADGTPFAAGTDGQRYARATDGSLRPLTLRMAITQQHAASESLVAQMGEALRHAGATLVVERLTLPQLMRVYYAQTDRNYDMLFLASNFYDLFDPYYTFHTDPVYRGVLNTTFIQDEALMLAALRMRETPSGDLDAYLVRWRDFQREFTRALPMIPLYSNTYADLHTRRLSDYQAQAHASFAGALLAAKFTAAPQP